MAKTARKVAAKKPSSAPAAIKPVKQTLTQIGADKSPRGRKRNFAEDCLRGVHNA